MKKKTINIFAALLLMLPIITNCKKGENDPFLSLKSRKSRLTGEWELKEGKITETSGGSTTTYTYNGTQQTVSSSLGSFTFDYTEKITFEKDRSYEKVTVDDGDTETIKGEWYWIGKNKNLDLKNKEAVGITELQYTSSGGTTTYTGVYADDILVIDQLKNKEMVIKRSYTSSSSGSSTSREETFTYEKK